MKKLTKKDIKLLKMAISSAIQNEESMIDAYTCPFCHGTIIFQNRPCTCKTGNINIKGSSYLIKRTKKFIEDLKKIYVSL